MEFLKRAGAYHRGMNMDDPFGKLLNGKEAAVVAVDERKKPAAKKRKTMGFCEYCGRSDHLTKRSASCHAKTATAKRFHKIDGSLLTDPPTTIVVEEERVPVTDAACDINRLDSLPFDHLPLDDDDSFSEFLDCDAFEGSDDEDSPTTFGVL
jgi:hypothetical protein